MIVHKIAQSLHFIGYSFFIPKQLCSKQEKKQRERSEEKVEKRERGKKWNEMCKYQKFVSEASPIFVQPSHILTSWFLHLLHLQRERENVNDMKERKRQRKKKRKKREREKDLERMEICRKERIVDRETYRKR